MYDTSSYANDVLIFVIIPSIIIIRNIIMMRRPLARYPIACLFVDCTPEVNTSEIVDFK